ncbi:MAG: DUF2809 domain-containing protein [Acidobacteriaceae bacterium]
MKVRGRRMYAGLLVATILAGLAWRMLPLGLSPFFFKYGGSALWAMTLYWLVALLMPRVGSGRLAAIAAVTAGALEFSRLWHLAALDAFRVTLAGRLLLGRYFAYKNIAAYWIAIGFAALVDAWLVRRDRRRNLRNDGV